MAFKAPRSFDLTVPSTLEALEAVQRLVTEAAREFKLSEDFAYWMELTICESMINAIRHGNQEDRSRKVHIRAEISARGAKFTVRDEGPGFDAKSVPDPCDPNNLFKPSGRWLMLIQHIMDEVSYNERGNEVTMVKYPE